MSEVFFFFFGESFKQVTFINVDVNCLALHQLVSKLSKYFYGSETVLSLYIIKERERKKGEFNGRVQTRHTIFSRNKTFHLRDKVDSGHPLIVFLWKINAATFVENETRREAKTFLVKTRRLFSSNQGQSF